MGDKISIPPIVQELPSRFADRLGVVYATSVSQQHKKVYGQFFTPIEIAVLMASYSDFVGDSVRILDPVKRPPNRSDTITV
jgi:adenine-specific DNA-methyltransferase